MTIDDIGAHRSDDRRGLLVFSDLPDELQAAEDSTQAADYDHVQDENASGDTAFTRPATTTEVLLLEHLGYVVPDDLTTHVRWLTPGLRRREWPTLDEQGS